MTLVDDYLDLRRAAGFKLRTAEVHLRSFVRAAQERGETHIKMKTAVAWAATAGSPLERHNRLRDLAIFARHLRAEDSAHDLPDPRTFPCRHRKRLPYIFSDEEIVRILDAAQCLGPPGTSRADTYSTLFGLLAAAGLRVGEALRLEISDLTVDGLLIRNTKYRKTRLVPLHPTTVEALSQYRLRWRAVAEPEAPFFMSIKGAALAYSTVWETFRAIEGSMDLGPAASADGVRRRTRMTDMRHTFAVRALEVCPGDRSAINRHMLALSTYLGHASPASTYWYLHATPRLMTDIADACEAWGSGGAR
jgi:integrase/recombinase XerD